jgi:DNA-binding FadR family transcriptional regulator
LSVQSQSAARARGYKIVETRLCLEKIAAISATPFPTAESKRAMAASIERVPRLLEQLSEFAVEDRRFCTLLFEPSPNRCIVNPFRICGIRCGILYDPDLPVPRRPHLRLC